MQKQIKISDYRETIGKYASLAISIQNTFRTFVKDIDSNSFIL